MKSTISLTSLAASAGTAHGAVVAAASLGSKSKARPGIPPMSKYVAHLRDLANIPQQDFDKLNQIVTLATEKPTRTLSETLSQIRQINKGLQQKPDKVHPLVLAISSIADDSAATASPAESGSTKTPRKSSVATTIKTVAADVAGAVLGAIAGARVTKEIDIILVAAIGGAMLASAKVGAGEPFPNIGAAIVIE